MPDSVTQPVAICWFRRALRVDDNRTLVESIAAAKKIVPVFVLDPAILSRPDTGELRKNFLFEALRSLDSELRARGGRLFVRHGDPVEILPALAKESGAGAVFFHREYEPHGVDRDQRVRAALDAIGVSCHETPDHLLIEPEAIATKSGTPYTVFSPFRKTWEREIPLSPLEPPGEISIPDTLKSEPLPVGDASGWRASEPEARRRLDEFLARSIESYDTDRDFPGDAGTSTLSPYLRSGVLSVRRAFAEAKRRRAELPLGRRAGVDSWINELAWRDFYYQILWHFPHVASGAFKPVYDSLAWENDPTLFDAWKSGATGYPFVDAAMRQLLATGWMHNRARMVVASFLTKDLLIDWKWGERHFMTRLVDGDLAANNGGWQWAASTGTDAQPYFRIFNPVSQGEKFDPDGVYVRQWVPELSRVPAKKIHRPWELSAGEQAHLGCVVGKDYPERVVDHALRRDRALALYKTVGASGAGESE